MVKQISTWIGAALILTASIFFLRPSPDMPAPLASQQQQLPATAALLLEYPQGEVSADARLTYRFNQDVIPKSLVGKPADSLVRSTPVNLYTSIWLDQKTLQLVPVKPLASGVVVALTLSGQALASNGLVSPHADFTSQIQAIQQRLSLQEQGFEIDDAQISYVLEVSSHDDLTADTLRQLLVLDQSSATAAHLLFKQLTPRRWHVTATALGQAPGSFRLRWKHQLSAKEFAAERILTLPEPQRLSVLSTRFDDQDGQRISVSFSQPLANQELTGLVKLNDQDVRARIHGNRLDIFPANKLSGLVKLWIADTLKSAKNQALGSIYQHELQVSALLPAVKFIGNGYILPSADRLLIPVEATNVSAVQLRIFRIFPDNIPQLLRAADENLNTDPWTQQALGRYIAERTLPLNQALPDTTAVWQLDVTDIVGQYRGSVFSIEARVLPQHSLYPCDQKVADEPLTPLTRLSYDGYDKESDIPWRLWKFYQIKGDYDWDQRNNPCHESYYRYDHSSTKTFIASNLGLIAKSGQDGQLHVFSTALAQGLPLGNVKISAYNYQQQLIGQGQTDASGMVSIKPEGESYFIKAEKDGDTGYLKVPGNAPLPTNQFDTGGATSISGVKAFFYAERNVWRPGDNIYLNLIVQDKAQQIPRDFPISLDFFSPNGQKISSVTAKPAGHGFYRFDLSTAAEAPTGNYTAIAKVADNYFDTVLKVENILPNRLKLTLALPDTFTLADNPMTLSAQWLSGASAEGLKADVELKLSTTPTQFDGLQGYLFDDARRQFSAQKSIIWQGKLGPTASAGFHHKPALNTAAPGVLKALFLLRVFEPSGQFSTQYKESLLHPYRRYAGLSLPEKYREEPLADAGSMPVNTVLVDQQGKKQPGQRLIVQVFKLRWSWWWDSQDNQANYASDADAKEVFRRELTTDAAGMAGFNLQAADFGQGRYRLVVCDNTTDDHCSSQIFYIGWGWSEQQDRDSATRLGISADKAEYQVGDSANINLPAGTKRQVLLTLENGSQLIDKRWYSLEAGQNHLSIALDKRMVPNVYAHVSQILPHGNRPSDLPLRSYGVVNLMVKDPASQLQPQLTVPKEVAPESSFTVRVSEQHGQAMTYTLALVDEGLLGITDFKTPAPHSAFYRREALGVRTWDLFDDVVGAYASDLSRLLAVGGSELIARRDNKRMQRFKPLAQSFGPFTLAAGASAEHQINLPPYIGAVRAMLVAGNDYAYGQTEAPVSIRQDLDLLTTAPRLVGPNDEFSLPVTLFWQGKQASTVKVTASADDKLSLLTASQSVTFSGPGEQTVLLRLKAKDSSGIATLTVQASNGQLQSQEVIHLPVRLPNAPEQRILTQLLAPGESWQPKAGLFGIAGSNAQWFNVLGLNNFNLTAYFNALVQYPHSCVEQTTSKVLPLLFAARYQSFSPAELDKMTQAINQQLQFLAGYQLPDGRFAYWRDGGYYVEWADLYVGYFMQKARSQGYQLPQPAYANWLNYHKKRANQFDGRSDDDLTLQALRLALLAQAEQADQGAMNRLRDILKQQRSSTTDGSLQAANPLSLAQLYLAQAYLQQGQQAAARELMDAPALTSTQLSQLPIGSALIQRLVRIQTLAAAGQNAAAMQQAHDVMADIDLSAGATIEQALGGQILTELLSNSAGNGGSERRLNLIAKDQPMDIALSQPGYSLALPEYQPEQFKVTNTGTAPLFVSLLRQGIPAAGTEQAISQGLHLSSRYTDLTGQPIDISTLKQGSDFIAWVSVENLSAEAQSQLALTQVFAAGFELRSAMLAEEAQSAAVSYQKTGDDRLYTYLDLAAAGKAGARVVLKATLNATYAGRFYLPAWSVQSMYKPQLQSRLSGQWVEIKP